MSLQELLNYNFINNETANLSVYHLLLVVLVIIVIRLLLWAIRRFINKRVAKNKFDAGRGSAFYQIVKYILVVVGIAVALQVVGIKITLLLAGSAALLVGLGLGVQQIFNDLVSGIILLFEGSVSVGDIVEINGLVGKVQRINIRTSDIETRDQIVIVVPNSKLVSDNVINWSHNRNVTRFNVKVGVAYGSDVELVRSLMVAAANEHNEVVKNPEPVARFIDFGDSSLDFEILFWSARMFEIENTKSDLRCLIDKKFRENNVTIPFPQRDLHFKSAENIKGVFNNGPCVEK